MYYYEFYENYKKYRSLPRLWFFIESINAKYDQNAIQKLENKFAHHTIYYLKII